MVTALTQDKPAQRTCAIKTDGDSAEDLYLMVKACPFRVNESRMLLLFIQDITEQQRLAALGRVFFHDIANLTVGLINAADLLQENPPSNSKVGELVGHIGRLSNQLYGEVTLQKQLVRSMDAVYRPLLTETDAGSVLWELADLYSHHPAAEDKKLILLPEPPDKIFDADRTILLRVLGNMVANALEASGPNEEVRVWAESGIDSIIFKVWNRAPIKAEVVPRMFQRNISTKEGSGRGLGTYSMKLFGEEIMGGKVDFTTSEAGGTTFSLALSTC